MHHNHDPGLDQQRGIVSSPGPVEDFEQGGCEHDERDVEGEAGGGAGPVDGEDLVGIGCQGRDDEAGGEEVLALGRGRRGRGRGRTRLERWWRGGI